MDSADDTGEVAPAIAGSAVRAVTGRGTPEAVLGDGRWIDEPGFPRVSGACGLGRPVPGATIPLDPFAALHDRRALLLMSIRDAEERAPLVQKIFDEVAIAIVEGRLRPGDTLNSVELARRFGTSRLPVREALTALERQGLVVVPPRRRAYVAQATLQHIKEIYDLRACLSALASELIVAAGSHGRLQELWIWQEALEDDARRGAVEDYFWHNVGFRLVEVRIAGSDELARMLATLGLRTLQYRHLSLAQPGRLARSAEDHRRLLLAYEDGDRDTAVCMTRALVMSGYRAIEQSGLVGLLAGGDGTARAGKTGV